MINTVVFGVSFRSLIDLGRKLGFTHITKKYIEEWYQGKVENLVIKKLGTDNQAQIIPILERWKKEIEAEKKKKKDLFQSLNKVAVSPETEQVTGAQVDPVVLGTLSFAFKSADIQAQAQAINQAATAFLVTPDEVKRRLELALNMQFKTENETGTEN